MPLGGTTAGLARALALGLACGGAGAAGAGQSRASAAQQSWAAAGLGGDAAAAGTASGGHDQTGERTKLKQGLILPAGAPVPAAMAPLVARRGPRCLGGAAPPRGLLGGFLARGGSRGGPPGWAISSTVGGLSALLAFACATCLVEGVSRLGGAPPQYGAVKEPPEQQPWAPDKGGPEGSLGSTRDHGTACEETSLTLESREGGLMSGLRAALEGQIATLTSELSRLNARSQHLETKVRESERKTEADHLEERGRLMSELQATAARADEAERARHALEEELRSKLERLEADAKGRLDGRKKQPKCGCSIQ